LLKGLTAYSILELDTLCNPEALSKALKTYYQLTLLLPSAAKVFPAWLPSKALATAWATQLVWIGLIV